MKYPPRLIPLDPETGSEASPEAGETGLPDTPGGPPLRPEDVADTLARTIWAEARDRSLRALEAMAAVVLNRARRGRLPGGEALGAGVAAVCLQPGAFVLGTPDHPDRAASLAVTAADPVFAVCLRIARVALAGALDDPTHGATHVHRIGESPPWAQGRAPAAELRGLLFYNDIL